VGFYANGDPGPSLNACQLTVELDLNVNINATLDIDLERRNGDTTVLAQR
jgi:hypothetical protein